MLHGQKKFYKPGHPGSGFAMSDICFDGADIERMLLFPSIYPGNGRRLHLVAYFGAGSMGFHVLYIFRPDSRTAADSIHETCLCLFIWRIYAAGFPILVHSAGQDDSPYPVMVTDSIFQAFKQYHPRPLASYISICLFCKCPAPAGWGKKAALALHNKGIRCQKELHPCRQGHVTIPLLQA